jgi:hypothetical protein
MCANDMITYGPNGRRLRGGLRNIGLWVAPELVERIDRAKKGLDLSRQKWMEMIITQKIEEIEKERGLCYQ